MKRHLHHITSILCLITSFLSINSCTDDLDITPDGRLDIELIFQDPNLIASYLSSAWEDVPYHMFGHHFFSNLILNMSDEGWDSDDFTSGALNTQVYVGNLSASNHVLNDWDYRGQGKWDGRYWTRYWRMIRILNQFIIKMDEIKGNGVLDEATWDRYKGEAHVMRAYYFNMLLKFYGDLPIITSVNDVNTSYEGMKRDPAWKGFQFVVEDCREALKHDNLPWHITNEAEKDRMTKAIACAIMSQASIFAASPLFCHEEDLWEWAYATNKDAFDMLLANGYELYKTLSNPLKGEGTTREEGYFNSYHEYFALKSVPGRHPEDKETIWGATYVAGVRNADINQMPVFSDGHFKAGYTHTQELVDAYDMLATGEPIYDLTNPYVDEKHTDININPKSGYNPADPYSGRDPRFYATVFYNLSKVNTGILSKVVQIYNNASDWMGNKLPGSAGNSYISTSGKMNTHTGYYNRKYMGNKSTSQNDAEEGNWKRFRLGEVYLNYAEAAIEAGHIDEGLKLINNIRHRAGFDPSVDKKTTDQSTARLFVHHERHVELAMEEHRYFDVRRWGRTGEDIQEEKYNTGMWIFGTGNKPSDFTYHRFVLGPSHGEAPSKPTYTAKNRLLPIPLKESSNLGAHSGYGADYWQNPGW
ncbi:MAG: RagB/SusD family nutrient uptake outer membrane protein, partial [Muribaculum sp.]|nr:RagB/SusD family nutrient uptake outer membrane protein [Muribaculum sp.]